MVSQGDPHKGQGNPCSHVADEAPWRVLTVTALLPRSISVLRGTSSSFTSMCSLLQVSPTYRIIPQTVARRGLSPAAVAESPLSPPFTGTILCPPPHPQSFPSIGAWKCLDMETWNPTLLLSLDKEQLPYQWWQGWHTTPVLMWPLLTGHPRLRER